MDKTTFAKLYDGEVLIGRAVLVKQSQVGEHNFILECPMLYLTDLSILNLSPDKPFQAKPFIVEFIADKFKNALIISYDDSIHFKDDGGLVLLNVEIECEEDLSE